MPRVHFVKSARKDNPVAKKGESYYWWKPMVGGRGGAKRFSKEQPSRSQTTQSEFLGGLYAIEDDMLAKADSPEALREAAENLRELGQEQQDKFDNMPEGLQQGDSGQMLEERANGCEEWASHIDQVADELENSLSDIEERWNAWQAYHEADDENAEEPDGDEPEGDTLEEARQALIDEAREEAESGNPL